MQPICTDSLISAKLLGATRCQDLVRRVPEDYRQASNFGGEMRASAGHAVAEATGAGMEGGGPGGKAPAGIGAGLAMVHGR